MTNELKPCPFCGGEAERDNPMIDYASGHGFHCPTCNAYFQLGDDDMEADERWNTRYSRCVRANFIGCNGCHFKNCDCNSLDKYDVSVEWLQEEFDERQ